MMLDTAARLTAAEIDASTDIDALRAHTVACGYGADWFDCNVLAARATFPVNPNRSDLERARIYANRARRHFVMHG